MTARRPEDEGAIQVVEAILVAILVAGALIFFALAQRPSLPPGQQPSDLAGSAQDALRVMQGPAPGTASDELTAQVRGLLSGTADRTLLAAKITSLLPDGLQFSLRTDNGTGSVERLNSSVSGSVAFPVGAHDDALDALARICEPDLKTLWPKEQKPEAEPMPREVQQPATAWMS